jgi:heterodisulfide reductase subunit C2
MLIKIGREVNLLAFSKKLEKETGTDVRKCYQCGKCTAGCPMNFEMDISPSQVIRFCQLGMEEKVLHARTMWYCIFCDTCSTRCPQGVDIKGVMDGLRRMSIVRNIKPKSNVRFLEKAFQSIIYIFGRVYEPGMVGMYNLRSGNLLHDVGYFPLMLRKRKISLKPHFKRTKEVRQVMKRAQKIKLRKAKEQEETK